VQTQVENVQSALYPDRILLCDRGTVDGAAYWPDAPDSFFGAVGTTFERELARYDAVLFFETAAAAASRWKAATPRASNPRAGAAARSAPARAVVPASALPLGAARPVVREKIMHGLALLETLVEGFR
jgi:hypothetical protein